ncbi:MAG: hypothetical protein EBZ58_02100 [Bacteroidetes bacterium]|jgi:hypothetical protein|nr:hypothetical protein [Bacteroidota bacterium]
MDNKETKSKWEKIKELPFQKKVGYLLLTPPMFSILLLLIDLLFEVDFIHLQYFWTGDTNVDYHHGGGGGFTSALPIYFGLMAIAGAYLIKEK